MSSITLIAPRFFFCFFLILDDKANRSQHVSCHAVNLAKHELRIEILPIVQHELHPQLILRIIAQPLQHDIAAAEGIEFCIRDFFTYSIQGIISLCCRSK
ncbi:MAG: hypothetical protein IIU71_01120, partial [Selenomonadaceae bacterium]|nr:hypothetical protein [Selenomonadaceae bacterium]